MMSADHRKHVQAVFSDLKLQPSRERWIPLKESNITVGHLRALAEGDYSDGDIALLAEWRARNQHWFPTQFGVTLEGTKKWLDQQVIGREDRILFIIQDLHGTPIGHVGLASFDFEKRTCEMDNVVRGRNDILKNGVVLGYGTLALWAITELLCDHIYARLFADNKHSVLLQMTYGFHLVKRIPLVKRTDSESVRWVEIPPENRTPPERYLAVMGISADNLRANTRRLASGK